MTTANTSAIRVTELDFLSIRNNLKDFLRSQDAFSDYDFEGSGMAVLLDLLAVNTHYMSYYLNMTGNEMFLDTAQIRASILSHAKNLNYVPASPAGALVRANIMVTPSLTEDQNTNIITLDKYTKFLGQDIDGVNYQFVALHSNTVAKESGVFNFANVYLKQGEVVTRQFLMSGSNASRRFEIPSANVDLSTLTITVQESASNTYTTEYTLNEDITELTGNSTVYFVEENQGLNYTFYFGDNILGKRPKNGNIIIATYLDVVGSPANNVSKFYQTDPIAGEYTDNVVVTAATSSYGGSDKETIEQVRFRAPYFYTAQNRAVNTEDYKTLIMKDYNNIDSVAKWGGEDNDPIIYGKVFLSLKTKGNYQLTNYEKEVIKDSLIRRRNVVTITPEIVDPDYVYLLIKGSVNYNPSLTSLSSTEIQNYVKAAVADYTDNELDTFDSTFRKSRLQSYIDGAEKSILGSDISIYAQKRILLDTTKAKAYSIPYNMPLKKGYPGDPTKFFSSPEIQTYDSNGISRNIYFEEKPFGGTGVDSITVIQGGANYLSTPSVTITGDGSGATAVAVVRNGTIAAIHITSPGINYTHAEVAISGDGSGATAIPRLESRSGIIRTFYFKSSGEKVFINEAAGTVSYDSGALYIDSFLTALGTPVNRYYSTDIATFNYPLENEIILPLRNRILTIDQNDPIAIQLNMIAEN